jgi:ribosomal protein S18 acetylase RimI-like enzyme
VSSPEELLLEESSEISKEELLQLYQDAGWSLYTRDPELLCSAVRNSLLVVQARVNGELAGLIRCVGDGRTIIFIQDIIVFKKFRRRKIGTRLVEFVLRKYGIVRQIVLLTDDNPEQRAFYRSLGFDEAGEKKLLSFVRIRS